LKDIRTVAGKVDQTFKPYKAYLRVSCLEMEAARMNKERDSILQRLHSIESRLRQMEVEKCRLLESVGRPPAPGRCSRDAGGGETDPGNSTGFRLRY
jgi:hypothetical protein